MPPRILLTPHSWMPGGEWGFEDQTRKGNITPPYFLTLPGQEILNRIQNANNQRGQFLDNARNLHIAYWNTTAPGKTFPHELYSQGWEVGFSDALAFFKMRGDGALGQRVQGLGGDKIGCLEIWTKKRCEFSQVLFVLAYGNGCFDVIGKYRSKGR